MFSGYRNKIVFHDFMKRDFPLRSASYAVTSRRSYTKDLSAVRLADQNSYPCSNLRGILDCCQYPADFGFAFSHQMDLFLPFEFITRCKQREIQFYAKGRR